MTTTELKETAERFVETGELPSKDWIMSLTWTEFAMYTTFVEKTKEKAEKLKIRTQHEKLVNNCIEAGKNFICRPHKDLLGFYPLMLLKDSLNELQSHIPILFAV